MNEHPMTQADWDAINRELEQQIKRVNVDMFQANGDLHQIYALSQHESGESEFVDLTGIVDTLQTLSDGAGTAAFVEAYNSQFAHYADTEGHAPGHGEATAVRFRMRPLPDDAMIRFNEELGSWQPALEIRLASSKTDGCTGAIVPVDHSAAALARLMERLRADPRVVATTVTVGRFPVV
jgi:hypothetical protein